MSSHSHNQVALKTTLLFSLGLLMFSAWAIADVDHSNFDAILKDVVANERVDYGKIKANHLDALNSYLDVLAQPRPAVSSREEQLAYYINLYNATMIKAVIDRNPATFKPSDNDFAVFKEKLVRTNGKTLSLNELENDVIRKQFKDPRVHAALVCAAVSCPPIIPRAYRSDDLDAVLTENVRRWLNTPQRNEIDSANKTLRLSKIFDWYSVDFGGPAKVAEYVQRYVAQNVSGFKVEFKEYDWTLNRAN